MAKYIIEGGKKLNGEIKVGGNKNAILPIMAATLLTSDVCELTNVPKIRDVVVMGEILKDLGVTIEGLGTDKLTINAGGVNKYTLNPDLVCKLRASILLLGPLLARFGKAEMRHPGGCIIGRRAVGTHFDAVEAFGAKTVTTESDYKSEIITRKPANILLDEASVTATENALMLAVLTPGVTTIENAACEPHVEDLASLLNKMGAKIQGAGSNIITINGVEKLKGAIHSIGPDHIDVGTFAIAAAVTGGTVKITNTVAKDLRTILLHLGKLGVNYELGNDCLKILPSKLVSRGHKIKVGPWPAFPTDLLSPFIVLATQADGSTLCHDWMYESRMFFVEKLINMGANIVLCDPHRVIVVGRSKLWGKTMDSPDIRAGIAMVTAALCAEGQSVINNVELVERGYEDVEERLKSLGASIKREE